MALLSVLQSKISARRLGEAAKKLSTVRGVVIALRGSADLGPKLRENLFSLEPEARPHASLIRVKLRELKGDDREKW
jgi:hypothetical protein